MDTSNLQSLYRNLNGNDPEFIKNTARYEFHNMITEDADLVNQIYGPGVSPNLDDYDDDELPYLIAYNLKNAGSKNADRFIQAYDKVPKWNGR